VSDGLGGHGGGQIASSLTAEYMTRAFMENPKIDREHIQQIFEQANARVLDEQSPALKMKSTGVALFINDGSVIWGHVGDSRLYHFVDKNLTDQTLDHSMSQMAVFSGEITADQIRHHDDRNRVLRAFGGDENIKAEISAPLSFNSGFHAFLLCTDGFWEYVLEQEMEYDLADNETPYDWLQAMMQKISQRAPEDSDNYSAAAVFVCDCENRNHS
jgi:serine/threonine protein phosphatase PrpC